MSADDFPNLPSEQGFPPELDPDSPYTGNRPASGARRATPGEVLSTGFQGAQNAGDFLGLDVEFTGSQDQGSGYGGDLDLVPPPGTYDGSQLLEPAPLPEGDPVQEFAEAPSAFQFGEDLGSEEADAGLFEEETSPSRTPMLVAALAVAALTAAGVMYGPKLYSSLTSGNEIPRNVAVQPRPTPAPAPADPTLAPIETPVAVVTDPVGTAPDVTPVVTPEPVVPETAFDPSIPLLTAADDPVDASIPTIVDPLLGAVQGGTQASVSSAGFPDVGGPEFAWASPDELELIWRGSQVPLEALRAPAKTMMPRIGDVMVFTTTGDVFEGRLYAVGENRVWIDAEPGRIGIDADQVEKIEVLPPSTRNTTGEVQIAGGKRVRASVRGGVLYGRVLKTDGEEVVLVLDDGGRVSVKAHELEDIGTGRVSVVGR